MERLTVKEVAEKLKVSPQQVRLWIKNKVVNFGIYSCGEGNERGAYYIFKDRLEAYLRGSYNDGSRKI